jgi:putative ABC transport system permease protein
MIKTSLKMLIGNRAAFIGMIFGIFLSILLISQQSAIYLGLISRSYRVVTDNSVPDIWVIDPATQGEDLIRSMPKDYLQYVKSIPNIEWAVPVSYLLLPLKTASGKYKIAEVYGIDEQTLIGMPHLLEGNIEDLYRQGAVIVDANSAENLLATTLPDGRKIPLKIGDSLEINDSRAVVVGFGKTIPGFFPQPIIFAFTNQVQKFSGSSRMQYIAAKARTGADIKPILKQINSNNKVLGLSKEQLETRIAEHFLKTGILINYGISVLLGMIIGFSIAGQLFYVFTNHNLSYYALIKALGGTRKMILKMVLFQAFVVGLIGYVLGTAVTLLWGFAIKNTTLAFKFPPELLLFTAGAAIIICAFIAFLSIKKVFEVDPHMLMVNL